MTRSEDDIWLDTALARLVQIYCGMSLRADEIVPIAALAQITREQASARVPLARLTQFVGFRAVATENRNEECHHVTFSLGPIASKCTFSPPPEQ